jgi:NAD-dependent SIR2 family protein deacetylase
MLSVCSADIVFFGEPLPARFHRRRLADLAKADLLIVMGTSLVVQPFASMIGAGCGFPYRELCFRTWFSQE